MGIYQKTESLSKQPGSLFVRMSHYPLDVYSISSMTKKKKILGKEGYDDLLL